MTTFSVRTREPRVEGDRRAWPPAGDPGDGLVVAGQTLIDLRDRRRRLADDVRVSVIVPTLNEAANVGHVLPRIPNWVDEVLIVDGGSADGTVEAARRARPGVRVVTERRKGKGIALQTGFGASTGDIIVTIDADGSTDPAEIPAFVGMLLAGADLVKGSRFVHGAGTDDMGWLRRSGNWALTRLVRLLYGGRYTDLCYGYSAFWRHAVPCFEGDADGFEIETFINVRALQHDLRVAEVPSFEASRIHGQSNLRTFADGWRVLRTIGREFEGPKLRLVAIVALGLAPAAIAGGVIL